LLDSPDKTEIKMKRTYSVIVLLTAVAFACEALAQDAPMFRGNLQHTGVYQGSGLPTLSGVKWKFHTSGQVISSPAVINGIVYFGSTDGNLYAVDAASGTLKWKFATQSWVT
jgi:hypothetical protein